MRKLIAFTFAVVFAAGVSGVAFAECPGHTRTSDSGTIQTADTSGSQTVTPGK